MALKTWTGAAGGGDFDWSTAGNWDAGVPGIGDDAKFDNAVNCDLDVSDDITNLDMTGYTGTFDQANNDVLISGDAILDGTIDNSVGSLGEFVVVGEVTVLASCTPAETGGWPGITFDNDGAPDDVTMNGVDGFFFRMRGADTRTQLDAATTKTFDMNVGTWDADSLGMTINGGFSTNLNVTGGTAINNMVMTLDRTMNAKATSFAARIGEIVVSISRTVTATDNIFCVKPTIHGTLTTSTGKFLLVYPAAADWWVGNDGTVDVPVKINNTNTAPGADSTLTDRELRIKSQTTNTITMDGNINLGTGDFSVFGIGAGDLMTVTMSANALTCANCVVGDFVSATTGSGVLNLGAAAHVITGTVTDGNAANASNALALDSCYLELGATLDGDNIDMTGVDADDLVHIQGAGNGTVQNVNTGGAIVHCHNCTDGGGNDAAMTFDEHTPPGSLQLMGVGV